MTETVIIGAGIAGLAAGQYLLRNGQENFLILESSETIGGRVQTIEFDGKLFSIGPGWLHGKTNNPVFDILQELEVPVRECNLQDDTSIFVWDQVLCRDATNDYFDKRKQLKDLLDNIYEKLSCEIIDPSKSVLDIISEHSDFCKSMTDIDKTVLYTCLEIYLGAPIDKVSGMVEVQHCSIYEQEEEFLNFRILDPLGVSKMVDYLADGLRSKIRLGNKVETIDWGHRKQVILTSNNGQQFSCKNVIITIQSDLLAKKSIIFKPDLPTEKIASWQNVPTVNYCRLFAKFSRKFWPDKDWLIPVLRNVNPFNELLFWQNCASQNLCFENDNILICHFTCGYNHHSRFDVEKDELIELVSESMKNIFPDTFCKPTDALLVSLWNNDRFSGSFSITAPGFDKSAVEHIDKSIGPLHFAGDSVMVDLMGTMQGAYVSGQNAARSTIT